MRLNDFVGIANQLTVREVGRDPSQSARNVIPRRFISAVGELSWTHDRKTAAIKITFHCNEWHFGNAIDRSFEIRKCADGLRVSN